MPIAFSVSIAVSVKANAVSGVRSPCCSRWIRPSTPTIITKMPGRIVAILVEEGQAVEKGQSVVIVEAMKMENPLKATLAGTVSRILVETGDLVEAKSVLVELDCE